MLACLRRKRIGEEEMEPSEAGLAGVVLTDGVVTLRRWRPDDVPAIYDACQDPEIVRHTYVPQPYTLADAEGYVALCTDAWAKGTAAGFAIADAATDGVLGTISRPPLEGHRACFGYWLAPEARGRGVATRALRLIVDWTLVTSDVIRLELYTDLDNPASGRVAERAGFVREGIRRAWDVGRDGKPIDVIFYVRVRE
jgi:RimJ/RimL family protein N-acetyltransferase